ncbi:hypothetical protein [Microbulbifer sp. JMSA003]|uniref:hypothetical protein n=1 Tax=Microbulbifer sp. JMSA003 TaxID=3243369 RepID=UPI00403A2419
MLKFKESESDTKSLALHYAKEMNDELLEEFINSKVKINSNEMAASLTESFWKMTDLAIKDNEEQKVIEETTDIEFWMHKLFNKFSGYMLINGFEELWESTSSKIRAN